MSDQTYLVFVYGTLKKGERNHHYLKDAELVSDQCWTHGQLYDTGKGYPAMVQHSENRVYGELYSVTAEQLQRVDELEGYVGPGADNHYDRVVQRVCSESGEFGGVVYVYCGEEVCVLRRYLLKKLLLFVRIW